MIKVISVGRIREIEAAADAAGLTYDRLMQNAGRAIAERVIHILAGQSDARVTVLVGAGNNGGDGLVAGRIIGEASAAQVRFYLLKPRAEDDPVFQAVKQAGLFVAYADHDRDFRVLRNLVASADVVLDALFGIGIRLPIKGDAAKMLRAVRQALHDDQQPEQSFGDVIVPATPTLNAKWTRPYVLAVDCPSGLECDTGELDANTVFADETMTFIAAKPGLFTFPGAAAVGRLSVATIGVAEDTAGLDRELTTLVDGQTVREWLPTRPPDANKGTFGKALIVAGSVNYVGAAGLSALAAYRVGTGLVTVGAPQPVVGALCGHLLEPTWLLLPHDMGVLSENGAELIRDEMSRYDALLLGPGWGRETATRSLLLKLLEKTSSLPRRRSRQSMGFISSDQESTTPDPESDISFAPLVIDADGLNLLSELEDWWGLLPERTIITPHPGEMARLAKLEISAVQADRWQIARQKAADWGVVIVLKGAHTLVADPAGAIAVLPFKTDALATAGTGDVLAGAITGLLAQGMKPFEAATAGAYLHGLAGQQAALRPGGGRSVVAGDVLSALPEAINLVEQR